MRLFSLTLTLAAVITGPMADAAGQELPRAPTSRPPVADVFLDCQAPFCDRDHFRREIGFVNWVRDREDSDAHVLITARRTAGGGWEFNLAFIGRGAFRSRSDMLLYISRDTDTDAEVRDGLTHTLELGLVQYAAHTAAAPLIEIGYEPPVGAAVQTTPAEDPWNFWTFRVSLSGSLDGEAQQRGSSVRASLGASRTTPNLKIELDLFGRYSRDEFELSDTSTFINTSESVSADALVVWSLGPNLSAGVGADASRSTFSNRDMGLAIGPAIEYNVFPYEESTRKQITFLYRLEGTALDYQQITVEGELFQMLARHSLELSAAVQQPWGNVDASIQATQYLHDASMHRIDTFGGLEVRLFRGLSLDLFGRFSRIKDQFFLPAEGLTGEEILVFRRQRETDFAFDINIGVSFRFGSSFTNIVNPRMRGVF